MRPPKRSNANYERIQKYDEWIPGIIEEIKLEEGRRTGFKNDDGSDKFADQVRFKFILEGHEFPHYGRWMSYTMGEKSNLFIKYLKHLVEGAQPDMDFDLDLLKKMPIKTMWVQNGDFDNLEQIRPAKVKVKGGVAPASLSREEEPPEEVVTDDIPF